MICSHFTVWLRRYLPSYISNSGLSTNIFVPPSYCLIYSILYFIIAFESFVHLIMQQERYVWNIVNSFQCLIIHSPFTDVEQEPPLSFQFHNLGCHPKVMFCGIWSKWEREGEEERKRNSWKWKITKLTPSLHKWMSLVLFSIIFFHFWPHKYHSMISPFSYPLSLSREVSLWTS